MVVILNWLSSTLKMHIGQGYFCWRASLREFAKKLLGDRRDTIKKEVQEKLAKARKFYVEATAEWKAERLGIRLSP
jgi:hypothetical protein